jgi:hypothetical protein
MPDGSAERKNKREYGQVSAAMGKSGDIEPVPVWGPLFI